MTTQITTATAQTPFNTASVNVSALLATGGGCLAAPPAVRVAGSADSIAALYDGTSSSGTLLATFSLAAVGQAPMPNYSFVTGLYATVSGSTPGTFAVQYSGTAP